MTDWDDDDHWDEAEERLARSGDSSRKRKPKKDPVHSAPSSATTPGTVVTVRKQRCKVAIGDDLVTAWLSADMAAEQKHLIAVGDEVALEKRDREWIVQEVLPRRTVLSRPDPFSPDKERVVAANVDVVVQVSAAKEPPLKTGLIDRYLIAIERGGARPVICINKTDQTAEDERAEIAGQLVDYHDLGIPIIFCSASTGEGLDRLREAVSGHTAVLVGHSGVGKSSLLSALDKELQIATQTLHSGGRSGRHTTTSSTLYEFPDGTRLIDTPGIREFGIFQLDRKHLRFYFEEFEDYAGGCRFRDCTHLHEPDCTVKAAAETGELPRYERYVRMAEELDENR
ncbi:MAG: ribosome small subunit-dependent GTPase A [Acidobacteria bacterium]|nr:ribosome small subunit-dependent GTPase A [Acidobacteriota bacterium]